MRPTSVIVNTNTVLKCWSCRGTELPNHYQAFFAKYADITTFACLLDGYPFMIASSNGNNFRVTDPLCREFTGHRWIPLTKDSDAELWCFLWSAPELTFSKQSWGWWFETPSCSLWRHCDVKNVSDTHFWHVYCCQFSQICATIFLTLAK